MLQLTTQSNFFGVAEQGDAYQPIAAVCPPEVDLILSALDVGAAVTVDRRARTRTRFRACAALRLFSDSPDAEPWMLYTRDLSSKSLGFIVNRPLPLGYGGTVELPNPAGAIVTKVGCTIFRCRVATGDWYEGALSFNREQFNFRLD